MNHMYESDATLIFRNQKVTYDGFNTDTFFFRDMVILSGNCSNCYEKIQLTKQS